MKITAKQIVKTVTYFDVQLVIPSDHYYIATDLKGKIFSYHVKPKAMKDSGEWISPWGGHKNVGDCEFLTKAWNKTLVSYLKKG